VKKKREKGVYGSFSPFSFPCFIWGAAAGAKKGRMKQGVKPEDFTFLPPCFFIQASAPAAAPKSEKGAWADEKPPI
jgi:hypothetical protein